MTTQRDERKLEERIGEWRTYLRRRRAIASVDAEELEDHLRSSVHELEAAGLTADEAFLIAVKRLGDLDSLSREFANEYSERLWKQLVLAPEGGGGEREGLADLAMALGLAIAAAVAIKLPALFGFGLETHFGLYFRNFSLFALPLLALYFAHKRGLERRFWPWLVAPFAAGLVVVNWPAFADGSDTEFLATLHLPIALWLAVGFAYVRGRWRDHDRRMDFVRFSGEWFIYYALIALGGGVLMGFTVLLFTAIGIDPENLIQFWILPCGIVGAVIVAGWLVEGKQSVIENMAPVLTRLFTPLFTLLLVAFLATMLWTGSAIDIEREVLIGFDLLLVLVLGLVLYSISARDPGSRPGPFDALQLTLVIAALLVDAVALWAISGRISAYGASPNKLAALGENLILLVNLAWTAVLYARFLLGRASFAPLARWQTAYLPVYAVWAWVVVALFPLLFGFR